MDREHKSIDIAEFVANASHFVDELGRGTMQEFDLTRGGQVVASVRAPRHRLHGHLRGLVELPPGFDLTKPIFEDRFHAEDGRVHE